jgi:uncharacterized protein (DUF362 family)
VGRQRNIAYSTLREVLRDLGLDHDRFGTPDWNPLGALIRPGDRVLIKPNLVRHLHLGGGDYQTVVTHGSLIRAVLDYAALALGGEGRLTVGDAPVQSTDFEAMVARNGLREVCDDVAAAWGVPIDLVDFRLWSANTDCSHRITGGTFRGGDPSGYRAVNFGSRSLLDGISHGCDRFRVTNYDPSKMKAHHNHATNEYLIPQTVLDADIVLSLPKLKTHRKVGLTAALKNLVGINGHKDWLPHHRTGSARNGGDEYLEPSLIKKSCTRLGEYVDRTPGSRLNAFRRLAVRALMRLNRYVAKDSYLEGSWHGNDTLWRTVLDLNRLLIYADREGKLTDRPQRRCLTVVDAIIAGEGEGPMEPDPRPCGLLVAGINPVAIDAVLATLIGFDYRKLPLIANAFDVGDLPLADFGPGDVRVLSSERRFQDLRVGEPYNTYAFKPPSGWLGHVTLADGNNPTCG